MAKFNYSEIITSINAGNDVDDAAYDALCKAFQKHSRAASDFIAGVKRLDDADLSKAVAKMAASWKLETSLRGSLTFDEAATNAASVHEQAIAVAEAVRETLKGRNINREGFDLGRKDATSLRILEKLVSVSANLVNSKRFMDSVINSAINSVSTVASVA